MSLLTGDRIIRETALYRVYAVDAGYVAECVRCLTSSELHTPAPDAHEDAIRAAVCEVEHELSEDCAVAVLHGMKVEMDALSAAFDRLLSDPPNPPAVGSG